MGELYRKKGENRKAFECYNEALKYARELNDKATIAKVKEMIGALYTRKMILTGHCFSSMTLCHCPKK